MVGLPAGTSVLWTFSGDDSYARRSIAPMKAVGLRLDELPRNDAVRRYPQMSFSDVRTIFLEPGAGYLLARQACELVRETFVREGGEYRVAAVARPSGASATTGRI